MVDECGLSLESPGKFRVEVEKLEDRWPGAKALGEQARRVLLDHFDNCASGGTMDTTDVLHEIPPGTRRRGVFGIYDRRR